MWDEKHKENKSDNCQLFDFDRTVGCTIKLVSIKIWDCCGGKKIVSTRKLVCLWVYLAKLTLNSLTLRKSLQNLIFLFTFHMAGKQFFRIWFFTHIYHNFSPLTQFLRIYRKKTNILLLTSIDWHHSEVSRIATIWTKTLHAPVEVEN